MPSTGIPNEIHVSPAPAAPVQVQVQETIKPEVPVALTQPVLDTTTTESKSNNKGKQ